MSTAFYLSDVTNANIRSVNSSGVINAFSPTFPPSRSLGTPNGCNFDKYGNLYINDEQNDVVWQVIPSLVATIVAGTYEVGSNSPPALGPATSAIITPGFSACDSAGNLYISLINANCVAVVNMQSTAQTLLNVSVPAGYIAVVAGNGTGGFSGDGGQATSAKINDPKGIAVDPTGNLFIVDSQNYRVRRVDHATGVITTAAGTGAGPNSYTGDGSAATSAGVGQMRGICCDANGNFYVGCAEAFNNYSVVRAVNTQATTQTILTVSVPAGCIATVVGSVGNGNGYGGDGGAATNAAVKMSVIVWTLAIDPAGNLILDDLTNYRVREVNASTGIITTICGTGTLGNTGNGGAATSAKIGQLFGLAPVFPFVPQSTPCVIGESQLDSFPPPTSTAGDKFVRFRLRGFEGFVPRSAGQLVTITATLTLAGDSISQPLLANSSISPAGTFYTVEFWSNQRITSSANYNFTTSVDLSSAVPI